jgi:ABC-2 type transport system ATP-binding protein
MITVTNLVKRYGTTLALNNVNFSFTDGHIIAIMGENGAGKSTLLKICAGILPYTQGDIHIDTFSLQQDPLNARRNLGYLPEIPELYERITGREFLYYIASLRKQPEASQRIYELAKSIGIDEALDYEIGGYSKGMKQKISLLAALMHSPRNLLLDEPIYGLDPMAARTIQDFIKTRQGTTIIATHSTHLVQNIADTVHFLMHGRVIHTESNADLLKRFASIEEAYFHFKDQS